MAKGFACMIILAAARQLGATPPEPDRLTRGLNQFAIEAYAKLARTAENVIYSPFSISSALSMLLAGAGGQTAHEIAAVLHQADSDPSRDAALAKLVDQLTQAANVNGTELLNANGLWADENFRLQSEFRRTMLSLYRAPMVSLDFWSNPENARREINEWTASHTRGKIGELFGPGAFDRGTRLVLSSATYFCGKWQLAFPPQGTRPAPFHLAGGGTVETPFMNRSGRFGYAETNSLEILEMKYADGSLALDVLLPKPPASSDDIEKKLNAESMGAWMGSLESRTVEVALPKFRTDSEFSLREVLAGLGMPAAFSAAADFSRIDGRRDLFLSQVMHKAFVDISEEGTEAAAATGMAVNLVALAVPQHTVFRADHPFIFLIRDTRSGLILFAGRLMHPRAA